MRHGDWNTGHALPRELRRLLSIQCGVLSVRQAAVQLSRSTVRNLLSSRRWRRIHREVLLAHNGAATERQRLWVASLAAGAGVPAALGGRTALALHGLRGFASPDVDVLLPANRRDADAPEFVRLHRTTRLDAVDLRTATWDAPPCTSVERSVIDAASWARSDDEARTVVAMAFQQRLVTLNRVEAAADRQPRAKRRGLVLRTAVDAAGGAHALSELRAVQLLRAGGLPAPTLQEIRRDASGRRRYLDLSWKQWRLHIEIDGSHHLDVRQAWADAQRQNDVWMNGDRVLRFPAWVLREQPAQFVAQVRRALLAAGWAP